MNEWSYVMPKILILRQYNPYKCSEKDYMRSGPAGAAAGNVIILRLTEIPRHLSAAYSVQMCSTAVYVCKRSFVSPSQQCVNMRVL